MGNLKHRFALVYALFLWVSSIGATAKADTVAVFSMGGEVARHPRAAAAVRTTIRNLLRDMNYQVSADAALPSGFSASCNDCDTRLRERLDVDLLVDIALWFRVGSEDATALRVTLVGREGPPIEVNANATSRHPFLELAELTVTEAISQRNGAVPTYSIVIEGTPLNADVQIDGSPRGQLNPNWVSTLPAGVHHVRVSAQGYVAHESDENIRDNHRLNINLAPVPQQEHVPPHPDPDPRPSTRHVTPIEHVVGPIAVGVGGLAAVGVGLSAFVGDSCSRRTPTRCLAGEHQDQGFGAAWIIGGVLAMAGAGTWFGLGFESAVVPTPIPGGARVDFFGRF